MGWREERGIGFARAAMALTCAIGLVACGVWRDPQLLQTPASDGRADWQRGLAVSSSGSAVSLWPEWATGGTEPLMSSFWP